MARARLQHRTGPPLPRPPRGIARSVFRLLRLNRALLEDPMTGLCWSVIIGMIFWASATRAAGDEEAIEKVLLAEAKSSATFAEHRDKQAVLKLYTTDFSGVQDGDAETRDTIEKWLSEYGAALEQGSRVHFLGAVSNLDTHISGSNAWA